MAHHHHRSMRLKKPKLSSRKRQRPAKVSAAPDAGSDPESPPDTTIDSAGAPEPIAVLEARRKAAEEARKLEKANRFLNMEVKGAVQSTLAPSVSRHSSTHAISISAQSGGSVTSERGSFLDRLTSQTSRQSDQAESSDNEEALVTQKRGPPGVVRRMAERHHRKVEKRDKKRRVERLRRIAALDPLQEANRERGQAKETKFLALIRKYGPRAQEDSRKARFTDMSSAGGELASRIDLAEDTEGTFTDSSSMEEQSSYMVDTLDIVDPGVSTAGHLSNIGNSLIFPNIPGLYDRRPVIDLPSQEVDSSAAQHETQLQMEEGRLYQPVPRGANGDPLDDDDLHLDAYIHELLTKRQKFKRTMQGVWAFLKTPIGVIFGIYGFLVVFGGAALVLFLVGAIDKGKNKDYWIEVFSQFENALFTIPGVGLIPWRVRDTYRMGRIAHYQHLTWKLRKRQGLPALPDKNDIPSLAAPQAVRGKDESEKSKDKVTGSKTSLRSDRRSKTNGSDIELQPTSADKNKDDASSISSSAELDSEDADLPALPEDAVLSLRQAANLHRLQKQFADSQSWYRPHETFTHHAFSISYAVWITAFNDLNSIFQCALCGVMWGYATHYRDRPAWTTGTFMPISFLAGIASAIMIWKGGEKSKKQREVEEKLLEAFARDIDEQVHLARLHADAQPKDRTTHTTTSQLVPPPLPTVDEHPPDLDVLAHQVASENANR